MKMSCATLIPSPECHNLRNHLFSPVGLSLFWSFILTSVCSGCHPQLSLQSFGVICFCCHGTEWSFLEWVHPYMTSTRISRLLILSPCLHEAYPPCHRLAIGK